MRARQDWQPTKFVTTPRGLRASSDPELVGISSRLFANLLAKHYEELIQTHARGNLLDLGCGSVPLFGTYAELTEEVTCVDWGNSAHPCPHLDLEQDLSQPLPFENGSFDTILATDLIEHLPDPSRIWSEFSRLLRPGGKLILGVPFLYSIHEAPHDFYRYTEFALRRFCNDSSLELLELRRPGGALVLILDTLGKQLSSKRFPRTSSMIACGSDLLLASPLGKWLDARTREKFPVAYCLVARSPKS